MSENSSQHSITIDNQKRASLTGVVAVESFNERQIHLKTSAGSLTICGEGLVIAKFNTENGTLVADGKVTEVKYSDGLGKVGVIKKLFK
ncbi:MAG: sporulation protein YabP [Clostridiales bacterium]|jgi:sporulation protein YabP|nr:sporulation protein YabP [Clostridiales bacterium]